MDGAASTSGRWCSANILHPVSVVKVMERRSTTCCGRRALDFARQAGPGLLPEALLTERELEFFQQIKRQPRRTHHPFKRKYGTFTPLAPSLWTRTGNLACSHSTGGTARKLPGGWATARSSAPAPYADNELGAVSPTGWGIHHESTAQQNRV